MRAEMLRIDESCSRQGDSRRNDSDVLLNGGQGNMERCTATGDYET